MGATLVSSNTTLKVNRAITGATTVNANCYAVVDYVITSYATSGFASAVGGAVVTQRYFGPSQSIPGTFTAGYQIASGTATPILATYTLQSGVEFINTP